MKHSALLLAAVLICIVADPAIGCECGVPSLRKQVRQSSVVFAGTVTDISIASEGEPYDNDSMPYFYHVTFDVERVFKGDVGDEVVVRSDQGTNQCLGAFFNVGRRYIVYAGGRYLHVMPCSRSADLDRAYPSISPSADPRRDVRKLGHAWYRFAVRFWPF